MKPGPYLPHSHSHLSPGCPHSSDPVCYPDNLTWCHACSPLMTPPVMFTCPLRSRSLGAKSCCPAPYPLTRPHLALFCNHLSHSLPHPSFSPTWSPLTWPLTDPSLNPPSATFTCHSHLSPSPVSHLTLSPAPPQHATGRLLHPPRGRRRQLPGERLQDRVRQPSVQALRGGNSEAPAPHLQRHVRPRQPQHHFGVVSARSTLSRSTYPTELRLGTAPAPEQRGWDGAGDPGPRPQAFFSPHRLQFRVKKEGWGGGGTRSVTFSRGSGDLAVLKVGGRTLTVSVGDGLPKSSSESARQRRRGKRADQ